jgi:hypothetical protein
MSVVHEANAGMLSEGKNLMGSLKASIGGLSASVLMHYMTITCSPNHPVRSEVHCASDRNVSVLARARPSPDPGSPIAGPFRQV